MSKEPVTSRMELLQGTLDVIVLALRWGARHGYGLVQRIRSQAGNVLSQAIAGLMTLPSPNHA